MTRIPWTILVFLSALLILAATLLPGSRFQDFPGYFDFHGMDKLTHLLLFACFSFSLHGFLVFRKKIIHNTSVLLYLLMIGTIFGSITEFFQLILPIGRDASLYDLLADLGGVFAGFLSGLLLFNNRKSSPQEGSEEKVTLN